MDPEQNAFEKNSTFVAVVAIVKAALKVIPVRLKRIYTVFS
jgi:hypothetical protein